MNASWINLLWSASLLLIYVITSCSGLYLIKAAENWKSPVFIIGFVLYASGAVIWIAILRFIPLTFAFPIATGALMIGTTLTGVFYLGEVVKFGQIAGMFIILMGIALIVANR